MENTDSKLTRDQRLKILPLYIGQEAFFQEKPGSPEGRHAEELTWMMIDAYYHLEESSLQVYLTPLYKITDEHALVVARMLIDEDLLFYQKSENCLAEYPLFWFTEKDFSRNLPIYRYVEFCSLDSNIEVGKGRPISEEQREERMISHCTLLQVYQLLREWGYAVDYLGVNLFKDGLAIEK